jgi:hypothetical protein
MVIARMVEYKNKGVFRGHAVRWQGTMSVTTGVYTYAYAGGGKMDAVEVNMGYSKEIPGWVEDYRALGLMGGTTDTRGRRMLELGLDGCGLALGVVYDWGQHRETSEWYAVYARASVRREALSIEDIGSIVVSSRYISSSGVRGVSLWGLTPDNVWTLDFDGAKGGIVILGWQPRVYESGAAACSTLWSAIVLCCVLCMRPGWRGVMRYDKCVNGVQALQCALRDGCADDKMLAGLECMAWCGLDIGVTAEAENDVLELVLRYWNPRMFEDIKRSIGGHDFPKSKLAQQVVTRVLRLRVRQTAVTSG